MLQALIEGNPFAMIAGCQSWAVSCPQVALPHYVGEVHGVPGLRELQLQYWGMHPAVRCVGMDDTVVVPAAVQHRRVLLPSCSTCVVLCGA